MTEINETWALSNINIAVEEDSLDYPVVRMGKQGPLEHNYSIGHHGGTEAMHRDLKFVLFSGYEQQFLPLVGSGYHALVSDQGAEGDYFIAAVRADRLHANNQPKPVFRITAELRKESYTPPPPVYEWPDVCFYPTRHGGIWYTTDFSGHETSDQPIWTQTGTGGSWPGDNTILDFVCDIDDPFSNLYVLTSTNKDIIWYNGSTWSIILSRTSDYQNSGSSLYCGSTVALARSIFVDQANGTLWVLVSGGSGGANKVITVYKSINYGSSWTRYILYSSQAYTMVQGIMAYDDHIAIHRYGVSTWIGKYSTTGGSSWSNLDSIGSLVYIQHRIFIPMHTTKLLRRGYSGGFNIWENTYSSSSTLKDPQPSVWETTEGDDVHKMWGNPSSASHYRIIDDNHLHTTINTWTTNTDRGALQIPGYDHPSSQTDVAGMAYRVAEEHDEDRIVYFSIDPNSTYPHCIFVAYGETDLTPVTKSGNDPITPDGSSIPYTGGGCPTMACPWLFFSNDIETP